MRQQTFAAVVALLAVTAVAGAPLATADSAVATTSPDADLASPDGASLPAPPVDTDPPDAVGTSVAAAAVSGSAAADVAVAAGGDNDTWVVAPDDGEVRRRGTAEASEVRTEAVELEPNYTVPFWAGDVTPERGLNESVRDTDRETPWVLVQFVATPTAAQLDTVRELGYREGRYVTPTTRYAAVPRDRLEALVEYEFVRAVAPLRPRFKVAPDVVERQDETPGEPVPVTVSAVEELPGEVLDAAGLREVGALTYRGELDRETRRELTRDGRVYWVESYEPPTLLNEQGRRMVGVDQTVRNPALSGSLTGSGVTVGIIDSGLDFSHAHFTTTSATTSADWVDGGTADDGNGHGTHVAGTVAGLGFDPGTGGTVAGMAPSADLVIARKFDDDGDDKSLGTGVRGELNAVEGDGAEIVSNSWGSQNVGKNQHSYNDIERRTDKWARNHRDTLLVFANGNFNRSDSRAQYVSSPAIAKNVISVGAVRDGSASNGNVTAGSVGTTGADSYLNNLRPTVDMDAGSGRRKPDVYAPGHWTTSADLGGTYSQKLGTSMATPHVSGAAALYRQANPSSSANEIKTNFIASTYGPNYDGYGTIDLNNALFENRYESTHTWVDDDIKKPYKPGEDLFKRQIQEKTYDFRVPEGAEKVVVTLAWVDPPGNPTTRGKDTVIRNDLKLFVGPSGEPKRHAEKNQNNVKKIVVEPDPSDTDGQWTATVRGERVTAGTTQDYDLVYRVVTEEETLNVSAPERVTLDAEETFDADGAENTTFNVSVNGTGAPVGGTHVTVDPHKQLTDCGSPDQYVLGTLSEGYGDRREFCFRPPADYGEYPVNVTVNSTNGERPSITRTVLIEVPRPKVKLVPYNRTVSYGGQTTYRVVADNLSDGIDTYTLNVSVEDRPIGELVSYRAFHGPTNVNVAPLRSNDTLILDVEDTFGPTGVNVTLGELTVAGTQRGETNLSVTVNRLESDGGDQYPLRPQGVGLGQTRPPDGKLYVNSGPGGGIDIDTGDPVVGVPVVFNASDLITIDPETVSWSFGDGTTAEGSLVVSHTYAEPGEYQVRVVAVGADGEERVATRSVVVADDGPGDATAVPVTLVGAPDGLQVFNLTVAFPEGRVQSVEPGVLAPPQFEVVAGGDGASTVTFRGADVAQTVGSTDESLTLATLSVRGDAVGAETTVHDLRDDAGDPIPRDRIRVEPRTSPFDGGVPGVGDDPPTDPNGDGLYEDVDGDGAVTFDDAIALAFADFGSLSAEQRAAVDFDGDGEATFADAIALAFADFESSAAAQVTAVESDGAVSPASRLRAPG